MIRGDQLELRLAPGDAPAGLPSNFTSLWRLDELEFNFSRVPPRIIGEDVTGRDPVASFLGSCNFRLHPIKLLLGH